MDPFDIAFFRRQGHVTINQVFRPDEMDAVVHDIEQWGSSFLQELPQAQRAWYVDGGVSARTVLRKLDNPHAQRPAVQALARDRRLLDHVEALIGPGLSVYFSQIFFKPPEGGGPTPAHQDNFYFGPTDPEGMVTAWIALDDATLENGCLYFGDGSNLGPVYPHFAPEAEPFNLQLPPAILDKQPMSPAPVRKGGVSFHHGNTFHASGPNHSQTWRRACALHFVSNHNEFANPALPYDHSLKFRVS
jgi:ectoine hydroxylase-related dioxygenase (phytanoyl-CoA dioxygenase family)